MLTYNLDSLGWYNFERLTGAIMREILGPGVEAFGGTKDNGRDCIFRGKAPYPSTSDEWEGTWIIQVKHTNSNQVGALNSEKAIKAAFSTELASIEKRRKLSFENYLFVTNVPISGDGRDELEALFLVNHPTVNFRIIDGKDVCDFLAIKQNIRHSFPQLLGLADLSTVLNHDIYERAEAFLQLAKQQTSAFVRHSHYEAALELLSKKHFVVLDGPPEVGKTTIAYAIALRYAANGYHIVDLAGSSDVFFKGYFADQKTVFIADDAVGSITFESDLGEMWARDLAKIIIKLDSKHKLVWTTRRYILEDALSKTKLSEVVTAFPKDNDVLISVDQYSHMERVEMLYNHTKIRNLSEKARKAIRKAALNVIVSSDFTPLRVQQFLDVILPDCEQSEMSVTEISKQFIAYCQNPDERWSRAFENLSATERILLISLIDCGGISSKDDLQNSFINRCTQMELPIEFDRCLQKLMNSFIKEISTFSGQIRIQFQHPSVRDMVLRRVHADGKAKLEYIKLSSLGSLTSIVNNLLENPNNPTKLHEVIVDTIPSKDALLLRIQQISANSIEASKWSAFISSAITLINSIEKSNVNTNQIEISKEVVNEIISTTCTVDFFNAHENWSPSQWNLIIEGLVKILSSNLIKSEGPIYWTNLASLFVSKAEFIDGIKFVVLAKEWVPGIIKREMRDSIEQWWAEAQNDAEQCLDDAPDEDEPCSEGIYNKWWERSEPTYITLKELMNMDSTYESVFIDKFEEKQENIKVIGNNDDDDYEPPDNDSDEWNFQKLIDDI